MHFQLYNFLASNWCCLKKETNIKDRAAQVVPAWLWEKGVQMRKWRGNGERWRKWREIHSLHFLIFSLFPPSLSIFCIKNCLILSQMSQKLNMCYEKIILGRIRCQKALQVVTACLVTHWHSWLFLTNWETEIMSFWVSDWQPENDLDSIRNSYDVLIPISKCSSFFEEEYGFARFVIKFSQTPHTGVIHWKPFFMPGFRFKTSQKKN